MQTKFYTGPMFSGKTRKLVMSLERYVIAKRHVAWFEPVQDTRGGSHGNYIATRMQELKSSEYVHAKAISDPNEIIPYVEGLLMQGIDVNAVYVDEYHMLQFQRQFFYDYQKSKANNLKLYFSGLMSGSDANVLNAAKAVLPFMDEIVKENAICMDCGKSANYYRYTKGVWVLENAIDTGNNYECLCHDCYMQKTKAPFTI